MKILSSFTHTYVVPNLYWFFPIQRRKNGFGENSQFMNTINDDGRFQIIKQILKSALFQILMG